MKHQSHNQLLPAISGIMGLFALVLRLCLSLLGRDDKGLLIPFHPFALMLWLLTAAAVILITVQVRPLDGSRRYAANFPPSLSAAAGCFIMAAGILLSIVRGTRTGMRLELLRDLAGILSIPAMIWVGICRWRGRHPAFTFHCLVCLYLTLHTINCYQNWSSQARLINFLFPMMACILLTLFAYYQTAFDVGMGQRRMLLGTGLLGAFFCIASLSGGRNILLHAAGGIWMLTNLCRLTPPRQKAAPHLQQP